MSSCWPRGRLGGRSRGECSRPRPSGRQRQPSSEQVRGGARRFLPARPAATRRRGEAL